MKNDTVVKAFGIKDFGSKTVKKAFVNGEELLIPTNFYTRTFSYDLYPELAGCKAIIIDTSVGNEPAEYEMNEGYKFPEKTTLSVNFNIDLFKRELAKLEAEEIK